jgi:hypothetical protein
VQLEHVRACCCDGGRKIENIRKKTSIGSEKRRTQPLDKKNGLSDQAGQAAERRRASFH